MGYNTALDLVGYYFMTKKDPLEYRAATPEEVEMIAEKINKFEDLGDSFENDGNLSICTKWYDTDDDSVARFTDTIPDLMMIIFGDGDSSDDRWRCYYSNGKYFKYYAKYDVPNKWPPDNADQ